MAISKKLEERIKMAVRTPEQADELIALLNADAGDISTKPEIEALTLLPNPELTDPEDLANKVNDIISALKA